MVQLALPLKRGDEPGMASLVQRAVEQMPGVRAAKVRLGPEGAAAGEIPIATSRRVYGAIVVDVEDAAAWAAYEPYVGNLGHVVALAIENERQQRELQALLAGLSTSYRELESFSYSASHDLRAPLGMVRAELSRFLASEEADRLSAPTRRGFELMLQRVERMGQLVTDLLQLGQVERAHPHAEEVDLAEIARDVVRELRRREPGRGVRFDVADQARAVADPSLVRIVLDNLLGNAWKFTARKADAHIRFAVEEHGGETAYVVSDDGVGFDPAGAAALFEPFARLHAERDFPGTGIGLAIVSRIVQLHGGRVWGEGRPGEGATFRFTLPAPGAVPT